MTLAALIAVAALADYRAQFPLPGPKFGDGWGVNIHFTTPAPGEMDKIQSAGFRWVRMDLFWHQIERSKGKYDFSQYDVLMSELGKRKMRPILILDYGNDLYQAGSPRTPEVRAAFCRFVEAAIARYRGKGVLWEMWNEPNIHFWQPKPNTDEYILLAKEVGRTIRRIAPSEWYVGPATSGFDWTFLEKCFRAGLLEQFDAVTVHPYRAAEPETVATDWAKLELLIDRYKPAGKPRPMISGEWGYSDINLKGGQSQQADYAVRQYLTNLSCGVNLSIWYDWKDDGTDPKEPEHHFGIVQDDLRPKESFNKLVSLSSELFGLRYRLFARNHLHPTAWGHFLTDDRRVAGVAGLDGIEPSLLSSSHLDFAIIRQGIPWKPRIYFKDDHDLFEQLRALGLGKDNYYRKTPGRWPPERTVLTRSPDPFWIEYRLMDRGLFGAILAVCTAPISLRVVPSATGWELLVENPSGEPLDAVLRVGQGALTPVKIPKGETLNRIPVVLGHGPANVMTLMLPNSTTHLANLYLGNIHRLLLGDDGPTWVAEGDQKVDAKLSVEYVQKIGPFGQPSYKMTYNFAPGWRYACLKPVGTKPLPGTLRQFGYWLYGDGQGHMLRMRFQDATGQTFQPDHGPIDWRGWRWIVFNLDQSAQGRWGGANDGVIHYPIRIETAVLVDSMGGRGGKGEIFATDFTVFGS